MSELFKIKEVEIGGVFNLDKYENVRVSIRVIVNKPENVGKVFDELASLVEKTGIIQKACRRWKDLHDLVIKEINHYMGSAAEYKRSAERALERARKEAEQLIKKLNLELLPEEVKKKIQEDPVNAFKLGIISTECLYISDYASYIKMAKDCEEKAAKLKEELKELNKLYDEMKNKLHQGKLAEAAEAATKLWKRYEELAKIVRW